MVALWLAALWLGLIAPASVPEAREAGGEVIADALEVLDEPDDSGYASGELKRGDRVSVVAERPAGLAGDRPSAATPSTGSTPRRSGPGRRPGRGRRRPGPRSGRVRPTARMPGPPRPPLPRGTIVRLLDRPPLTLGAGPKARTWRAIAPPRARSATSGPTGVRLDPPTDDPRRPASPTPGPPAQVGDGDDGRSGSSRRPSSGADGRDHEVAQIQRKLADARTVTERGYDARGLLQASSRQVEGAEGPRPDRPRRRPDRLSRHPARNPRRPVPRPEGGSPGRRPFQRNPRRPPDHRPRPRPARQTPLKPIG